MIIFNLSKEETLVELKKNWFNNFDQFFVLCSNQEIPSIQPIFKFDASTVLECVNLDENIRFESFDGYDFISLIYFYLEGGSMHYSEINLYIGKNYIFLVLPEDPKVHGNFLNYFRNLRYNNQTLEAGGLISIYYRIFHRILTDLFDTLETYEGMIFEFEEEMIQKVRKEHLSRVIEIKTATAKVKKLMRPLLYIGDQFIVNENNFIPEEKKRFFKNIDIRMNKIYDFAVTLNETAGQLLITYDSKVNMQTNEAVTKLTLITVCIAPLTVITGIYGMNFSYMPELDWNYAYPVVLTVMAIIAMLFYFYFKKNTYL